MLHCHEDALLGSQQFEASVLASDRDSPQEKESRRGNGGSGLSGLLGSPVLGLSMSLTN